MKKILFILLVLIPIDLCAAQLIVVPVLLTYHGRNVQTLMAIDTGATTTTISPALADRMGIARVTGNGLAQMADGRTVKYQSVSMDAQTEGVTSKGLQVNIMEYAGQRGIIEGWLGVNFLERFKVTIDFKARNIDFAQ